MQKIYVIDTNVILGDANAILKFEEHIVVIPQTVINELDTKKKDQGEVGYNARQFSRIVDQLREKGSLKDGVSLNEKGGMLYVTLFDQTVANCLPYQDMSVMDNRILASAVHAKTFGKFTNSCGPEVILVSNDSNMRILADCFHIQAEDYKNNKVQSDDLYDGVQNVHVDQLLIDRIYVQKALPLSDIFTVEEEPYPNECFIFHSTANTKQSALARYDSVMKMFNLLPMDSKTVDILPKNAEQQFALDLLKDSSIKLVTMVGKAGTGKTMIAIAAGLHGVLETGEYDKILLLKPIVPMDNGHELGFLPGGLEEKLGPWMASYGDNIEQIMAKYMEKEEPPKKSKSAKKDTEKDKEIRKEKEAGKLNPVQELIAHGFLEFGSLEHARGRNWSRTYVILDEGQNTSKNTGKTILTRIGEGTKIVIMGDPSQIDSPYLDAKSNGLSIIQALFKNQKIAGHITLKKSERSELAEIASELLA